VGLRPVIKKVSYNNQLKMRHPNKNPHTQKKKVSKKNNGGFHGTVLRLTLETD
jgi:hypothetical protein